MRNSWQPRLDGASSHIRSRLSIWTFATSLLTAVLTTAHTTATMSRPTVGIISGKGESTKDTITVPNVFKVSSTILQFEIWRIFRRRIHTVEDEGNGTMETKQNAAVPRIALTIPTGTYPPGYRPRGPHWHEQEPPPAIRRVRPLTTAQLFSLIQHQLREGWSPDLCRVMGYWSCRCPYSSCLWWRNSPCRSGCLW